MWTWTRKTRNITDIMKIVYFIAGYTRIVLIRCSSNSIIKISRIFIIDVSQKFHCQQTKIEKETVP